MLKPQNESKQNGALASGNKGHVYLVGAGPGDPELITLKALRLLEQAEVVVYDRLVNPELLNHCAESCDRIYVGKRKNCHSMPQTRICELLVQLGQQGKQVVRLKGGDPFVFGRGGEEAKALNKAGVACEIIPGITAATGCAAATGIPLTHRDHAQAVTFITGHRKNGNLDINWALAAQTEHTAVFYMGLSCLGEIVSGLRKHGLPASTPIAVIANGSTPKQEEVCATLDDILHHPRINALPSPSLIIVGEVVGARCASSMDGVIDELVQHHAYAG
ncbi:MAG TPA: uroporphyrinogen-III C-methyltransferase [Porticoccaceae bacterium]|nr:uroporphyrinogen-III C-methyltransferase [Porticoccaceae bacterium]